MTRSLVRAGVLLAALILAPAGARAADPPADTLYARQDWPRAAAAYDALTKKEPANARAWFRLGVANANSGKPVKAIPAYRRAAALGFAPQFTWYNLACAYAVTKENEQAFAALDSLVASGYRQAQALETDTDFDGIRNHQRFAAAVARAKKNATPCADDPRSRELDFWVGEWDVQDRASGTQVGTSSVQLILGGCVVFENWTDRQGSQGKSFNSYNRAEGWWQQNWVSDTGAVNDFTHGRLDGGAMVYQSVVKPPGGGAPFKRRLSFARVAPERVRQHSERSNDDGKTWATEYDFVYVKKKAATASGN